MIERTIFAKLQEELKKKQITAVVGARQIGKTTALKQVYKQVQEGAIFISFEDGDILSLFENNIKLFIAQYVKPYNYIFIDEFQYAQQGGKHLKLIYDLYWKKIFISGSSKPELAIHSLGFLVGRVSLIEMQPLSFEEFVAYKSPEKKILLEKERTSKELQQLQAEFEEFIVYGGYPEVVKEKNFENKKELLRNIMQTYLFREIKDVLGFKETTIFERLLKRLAIQNGKLAKISSIAQDLNISWNKISEVLSILEQTNIIQVIKPYFTNKAKELVKTPKIYFSDLGFVNAILNNYSYLPLRSDKGEIYETFILQELIKQEKKPLFWNKQLSEVDFILEKDGILIAMEIKSKIKIVPRALKFFLTQYNAKKAYVFNEEKKETKNIEKIIISMTPHINIVSIAKQL